MLITAEHTPRYDATSQLLPRDNVRISVVRELGTATSVLIPTHGGWVAGDSLLKHTGGVSAVIDTDQGWTVISPEAFVFLKPGSVIVPVALTIRERSLLSRRRGPMTVRAAGTHIDEAHLPAGRWLGAPDHVIRELLESGRLRVSPEPDNSAIQPCSLDVRLGLHMTLIRCDQAITLRCERGDPVFIEPGDLLLAPTLESIRTPGDVRGKLRGKTELARQGIGIHRAASLIQPGSDGWIALEITVVGKRRELQAGQYVGTIVFDVLSAEAELPYNERPNRKVHRGESPEVLSLHADGHFSRNGQSNGSARNNMRIKTSSERSKPPRVDRRAPQEVEDQGSPVPSRGAP